MGGAREGVDDHAGVLVGAGGVGEGGQDEVEVGAVDAGDGVGQMHCAVGVDQCAHEVQDSAFTTGEVAEVRVQDLVVEQDPTVVFDADPGLTGFREPAIECPDEELDGGGQRM